MTERVRELVYKLYMHRFVPLYAHGWKRKRKRTRGLVAAVPGARAPRAVARGWVGCLAGTAPPNHSVRSDKA